MRHEQWLYFKSALDTSWCDDFVDYVIKGYEPVESTIGFKNQAAKSDYRECDIRWLDHNREKELVDTLWSYVNRANRDSFDVDVRYINELQFTTDKGDNEGRYGWHHDVDFKNPHPYHRKLSLTIQLSDKKDYKTTMRSLLELKEVIDTFFDNVMVNTEDLKVREARLALISRVRALFLSVADISHLSS